jgi:hypothetical protein
VTRPDQASAPEPGTALTEGERERLARAHVHISPADLFAAVEQIIRDRTPGIQAAALRDLPITLERYARDSGVPGVLLAREAGITTKHLSQMLCHHAGSLDAWVRVVHAVARAQEVRDSATGGGA